MSAVLWFWLGSVFGTFIGIATLCLLQASRDDVMDADFEEIPDVKIQ